jgi:fumarylacetoacetate (FAA) hydrolase
MKLVTLRSAGLDGELAVVSRDFKRVASAADIAPTLQAALDDWGRASARLAERYCELNDENSGEAFDPARALSPLPRAFQWCDGSVYEAHMTRMAKWTNKPIDPRYYDEPWMYQGASDSFLAPTDDIPAVSEDWGIDYEGEIVVVTTAVPYGASLAQAGAAIALVMLCNDVSLRNLMGAELSKGFGFVQSKPASAFAPVAVTPDELDDAWRDFRLHLPLYSYVNGKLNGDPNAGEMIHGFDRLVAHVAKTRALSAGSIIGGGTVASNDPQRGTSCLAERRVMEMLETGEMVTPFLQFGDRVRLEVLGGDGQSVFGTIDQTVVRSP